jgi:hypothetical protein
MIKQIFSKIIIPMIVAVITSIITTAILATPRVTAASAHTFLIDYFKRVTRADQRPALYKQVLTQSYQSYPNNDFTSYVKYWEKQKQVTVVSVIPVSGNPLEFTVIVTVQPGDYKAADNYWFTCNGTMASLRARLPWDGCPWNDIKIDNGQSVPASH